MARLERVVETLTPDRLRAQILSQMQGEGGETRRGVGVATIARPILDRCTFDSGADRSEAYTLLTEIIAERVALIPDMHYVRAMA